VGLTARCLLPIVTSQSRTPSIFCLMLSVLSCTHTQRGWWHQHALGTEHELH